MNLKELKYVLLGDDRLSSKLRNVSQAGDKAADSLRNSSNRLSSFRNNVKEVSNEIPMLGRAMRLATNPIVIGTAAVAALGVELRRSANEAIKFNSTFRELQNMNLDKTPAQLQMLKGLVRTVSIEKGFDINEASKAFYDVQSVTGMYGGDVGKIVMSQGEFAKVMKADFNAWIEGTGKAMANFGFGAEKLDEFNRSAYATIQVGALTFDQLAKVQSVYAGAAASAGQNFDTANKMLSIFTMKTKSADEAATLTKSLFNDLTKKASIDALKRVGISLTDADGKIKQVDKLMLELNKRFAELGGQDKRIIDLKNQFSGSDGFISMIQTATDQSGGLLRTLESFDGAKVNFDVAMKLAELDPEYVRERTQKQIDALRTITGESMMPLILAFEKAKAQGAMSLATMFHAEQMGREKGGANAMLDYGQYMYNATTLSEDEFTSGVAQMLKSMEDARGAIKSKEFQHGAMNVGRSLLPRLGLLLIPQKATIEKDIAQYKAYLSAVTDIYEQVLGSRSSGLAIPRPTFDGKDNNEVGKSQDDSLEMGLNSVAGGGNAIRNITVNITKLIESQNINTKNISEGQADIQRLVEEALMRAIAGTEQMLQ